MDPPLPSSRSPEGAGGESGLERPRRFSLKPDCEPWQPVFGAGTWPGTSRRGPGSLHPGWPQQGPSVWLLCSEHDGHFLGPSLLPSASAAASSGLHALPRSTCSLPLPPSPPPPLMPTGQTPGLGGLPRSAHGSKGQSHLIGFSAAGPAVLAPAATPLTLPEAPRQEQALGSLRAEGCHLEMDLSEENESGPSAVLCLP